MFLIYNIYIYIFKIICNIHIYSLSYQHEKYAHRRRTTTMARDAQVAFTWSEIPLSIKRQVRTILRRTERIALELVKTGYRFINHGFRIILAMIPVDV